MSEAVIKKEKSQTKKQVKDKDNSKEASIEEIFGQLDDIIKKLTDGEISLEDSFGYYESGMRLVKNCSEKIDKVEKQIIVLNEGNAEI